MRWYVDNPIDGNVAARSISVGLPPEDTNVIDNPDNVPQVGHAVPEADREVNKKPLQVKILNSIEGIDHNEERDKNFFNQLIESVKSKIVETEKSDAIIGDYQSNLKLMNPILLTEEAQQNYMGELELYGQSPFSNIINRNNILSKTYEIKTAAAVI